MKKSYPKFLLLYVCLLLSFNAIADSAHSNKLSAFVERAHKADKSFYKTSLFKVITGSKHDGLKDEVLLQPDAANAQALYARKPEAVILNFTAGNGKEYQLEMLRSNPFAENANLGTIADGKRTKMNVQDGVHYIGAIANTDGSLATMSVFADGNVMILFSNDEGNFVIGKLNDASGNYIFYNDRDMLSHPNSPCGVSADKYTNANNGQITGHNKTTGTPVANKLQLYWECDYQFYTAKGSLVNAQNYIAGLFTQVQAVYLNDDVHIELKSLYIWTTDDGYPGNTSNDGLYTFKNYWNAMNNDFDGDLAHLVTMDASSNGGLAYVDVLSPASRDFAYAYSEITGTHNTFPTYSWDVMVLSHETGHNVGLKHTHWCGWNTGAGGSCGSIDDCQTQEAATGCSSPCFAMYTNSSPVGAWQGSIMSYCHLRTRGINLANGFGPLPGDLMRYNIANTSTLSSAISATLTPTHICTGTSGAVALNFTAGNFGATPYTFAWSNGGNAQNTGGISTPGIYSVVVTDGNGATNTFSTEVKKLPNPGNGQSIAHSMPICCNNPVVVNITASVPADLSACQTVGWLRTTTPVANYATAKAAFAIATPDAILYSSNANSVNGTTAATLDAASPSSCVGVQTFYYTPFVTRKSRAINTITTTATAGGVTNAVMFNGATQSGNYVELTDQRHLATACDTVDTANVRNLSITISNYTGRANRLTLVVMDSATGKTIYRGTANAGNGTYTIPLGGYNILNAMVVKAFDYNCTGTSSSSANCVAYSLTISATRTVTYDAIVSPVMDSACVVGSSVMLSFAPTDCTPLAVGNIALPINHLDVYPNPASKSATLAFQAHAAGAATLKITDMVGRVVETRSISYSTGRNATSIDVQSLAKGVYFILLDTDNENTITTKLVVE